MSSNAMGLSKKQWVTFTLVSEQGTSFDELSRKFRPLCFLSIWALCVGRFSSPAPILLQHDGALYREVSPGSACMESYKTL